MLIIIVGILVAFVAELVAIPFVTTVTLFVQTKVSFWRQGRAGQFVLQLINYFGMSTIGYLSGSAVLGDQQGESARLWLLFALVGHAVVFSQPSSAEKESNADGLQRPGRLIGALSGVLVTAAVFMLPVL